MPGTMRWRRGSARAMFRAERPRGSGTRPTAVSEWRRGHARPVGVVGSATISVAAALIALWPYTDVISPGSWSFAAVTTILATVGAAAVTRHVLRRRSSTLRESAAFAAAVVVAVAVVTRLVAGDDAFLGLVPTPATMSTFAALGAAAWEEVVFGSAPLDASPGLAAALAAGFAVVAILLDQLVASRSAVIAILLTGVVGAVPMIVTLGAANIVWFLLFGVLALVVLRFTARRHPSSPQRSSPSLAAGLGVAALAATVVIAPALPVSTSLAGTGVGVTVDASLRLGDDLRQPNPVEVLTVATEGDVAPYLRLTTLSRFDGRVWQPDRGSLRPQDDGFGEPEWGSEIAVEEERTSIRVLRMSSSWLPAPYPATDVSGLNPAWRVAPENRTLVSRSADAVGNDYTVTSARVLPTLEQIRAVDAAAPDGAATPDDLPGVIAELADDVTAAASTDYDRLVALQSWFRSEFEYSLETPVDEGFDGTGAEAVARFLDERAGYCVHFAGAFALMSESLGIRTRIVVGYLPGSLTDEKRGDESVFSVSSDQLHSWPEALFPGIGWVPFEPTASLGVPTGFQPATTETGGSDGPTTPTPSAAPQDEQSAAPEVDRTDRDPDAGAGGELRRLDPTPVLLTAAAVILVVLLPALIRRTERALRMTRARRGDAGAAWAELSDTLVDLQLSPSEAETPRVRGRSLVRERGVDADAMRELVAAVERANYARPSDAGSDLGPDLTAVLRGLHRSVDGPTRLRALLLPRSLFAVRRTDATSAI